MSEILRSTPATLELQVYSEGTLTNLDANPTLVITDGNGDVVSSGAVTKPGSTTGIYRSVLPSQDDLKVLDAAWTGLLSAAAVTLHQDYEIVGNLLFTEAEARASNIVGMQTPFSDATKYSDSYLATWRGVIAETMEHRMKRGVIQRYCRAKFRANGNYVNLGKGVESLASGRTLNRPGKTWDVARIISATHNGTTVDPAGLDLMDNYVWFPTALTSAPANSSPFNVVLEYEYGPDPVWPETHQRAIDLLMANAIPKGYPSSATSLSNEDGTFRITNFPVAVEEFFKKHNYNVWVPA
jgi:hypothetical protein